MTVQYNGWTLKVVNDGIEVSTSSVVAEWDAWNNNRYTKKQRPYGTYTSWSVTCLERGTVAWANSVIGSLETHMGSLISGSLVFNEGDLYSGTFTAYLRGVNWHCENRDRVIQVDFQAE